MAEPVAGGGGKLQRELGPDHKAHCLILEPEGPKCKEGQGSLISQIARKYLSVHAFLKRIVCAFHQDLSEMGLSLLIGTTGYPSEHFVCLFFHFKINYYRDFPNIPKVGGIIANGLSVPPSTMTNSWPVLFQLCLHFSLSWIHVTLIPGIMLLQLEIFSMCLFR